MEPKTFPVWVTKYALTKGILHYPRARLCEARTFSGDLIVEVGRGHYYQRGEWFRSEEEAKVDARKRAARKLASLDKARLKIVGLLMEWA